MSVTPTLETVPEMAEQTLALLELGNLGPAHPQHEFSSFTAINIVPPQTPQRDQEGWWYGQPGPGAPTRNVTFALAMLQYWDQQPSTESDLYSSLTHCAFRSFGVPPSRVNTQPYPSQPPHLLSASAGRAVGAQYRIPPFGCPEGVALGSLDLLESPPDLRMHQVSTETQTLFSQQSPPHLPLTTSAPITSSMPALPLGPPPGPPAPAPQPLANYIERLLAQNLTTLTALLQ